MERAFSVEFDDFAVCEDRFAMVLSPLPSHSVRIFQLLLTLDVIWAWYLVNVGHAKSLRHSAWTQCMFSSTKPEVRCHGE
jgi:hypothetical protein